MTRIQAAILVAGALLAAPITTFAQGRDHAAMGAHDHAGQPAPAQAKPLAGAADVVVKVNGLVCDFCARSLEKTFKGTKTVSQVAVDLKTKEVRLRFLPGKSLDDATVRRLVKNAGYAVVTVQRSPA